MKENKQGEASNKQGGNNQPFPLPIEKDNGFQCKQYFFTYHYDVEEEDISKIFHNLSYLKELCEKWIWAEEYGESGATPHIQGAFILKHKMYAKTLQQFFLKPVHLVRLKSWKSAVLYCSKESGRIDCSEKLIKFRPTKCALKMEKWQQELFDLFSSDPDDRKVFWRWSESGKMGKTDFARHLYRELGFIMLSGKAADMKNGINEFVKNNGYTPYGIVIDIPRSLDDKWFSYTGLEEVKNMFFYSPKYEGGMVDGPSPHVLILSNEPPDLSKLSDDRWNIKCVDYDCQKYDFLDEL